MHTLESHEREMPDCNDPDCEFHHPEVRAMIDLSPRTPGDIPHDPLPPAELDQPLTDCFNEVVDVIYKHADKIGMNRDKFYDEFFAFFGDV